MVAAGPGVRYTTDPATGNVTVVPMGTWNVTLAQNPTPTSTIQNAQTITRQSTYNGQAANIFKGQATPSPGALAVQGCSTCTQANLWASGAIQSLGIHTDANPVLVLALLVGVVALFIILLASAV